jgi:hypothetical protein
VQLLEAVGLGFLTRKHTSVLFFLLLRSFFPRRCLVSRTVRCTLFLQHPCFSLLLFDLLAAGLRKNKTILGLAPALFRRMLLVHFEHACRNPVIHIQLLVRMARVEER